MLTIARLFGKSPFAPLQTHMSRVASCIEKLTDVLQTVVKQDTDKIEKLVGELCRLEHEADLTKNDIRNHLPKSLFLPIDRSHFLDILSIQDSIADQAEEIGILLSMYPLEQFSDLEDLLKAFSQKAFDVFWSARKVIQEIDELLESSFGGIEAEKVKTMVEQTAKQEHEAALLQRALMKKLFQEGSHLTQPSFYLWLKLVEEIGEISSRSERLANRIRMVLELK